MASGLVQTSEEDSPWGCGDGSSRKALALQTLGPEFDPRTQVKGLGIAVHESKPRAGRWRQESLVLGGQIVLPKW